MGNFLAGSVTLTVGLPVGVVLGKNWSVAFHGQLSWLEGETGFIGEVFASKKG